MCCGLTDARSKVLYVYPALPVTGLLALSLATAMVLHIGKSAYFNCEESSPLLQVYLLGQLSVSYLLVLLYANFLMDLVPFLSIMSSCGVLTGFLSVFFVGWTVFGLVSIRKSACVRFIQRESYFRMSVLNVSYALLLLLCICVTALALCLQRQSVKTSAREEGDTVWHEKPMVVQPPNTSKDVFQAFQVLKQEREREEEKRVADLKIEEID